MTPEQKSIALSEHRMDRKIWIKCLLNAAEFRVYAMKCKFDSSKHIAYSQMLFWIDLAKKQRYI